MFFFNLSSLIKVKVVYSHMVKAQADAEPEDAEPEDAEPEDETFSHSRALKEEPTLGREASLRGLKWVFAGIDLARSLSP